MTATVLVVEDNPVNRLLISEVLRPDGHRIVEASTLGEARLVLERQVPQLVLMDMNLPDGHGLDLVREIRADARLRTMRVAALTANAMESDRRRALDAGCDVFLTKPLDLAELSSVVDRLVAARP